MKKLISAVLALSILLTMTIPAFADRTKLGDVNGDDNISAVDARIILQVVAGIKEETEFIKSVGDVNNDGKISAVDARVVLQVVAGIIPAPERPSEPETPEKTTYGVGETWIVPGQWEITINSATIHNLCNSYSNENNGYTNQQVVIIEYTYKNLGIEDGLYLSSVSMDYYDEELETAEIYACTHDKYPKECIIGAKCTASQAVVLENYSKKITISIEEYDSDLNKHKALFEIQIEGIGGNDNNDNNDNSGNNNSTTPRADIKLKDFIVTNGKSHGDGVYSVAQTIQGYEVCMYFFKPENALVFACDILLDSGKVSVSMDYVYGESRQEVTTRSNLYSNNEWLTTGGYIYTSTYSKDNDKVYITYNDGWESDSAESVTESATDILFMQMEQLLYNTGSSVTLYDLGFVSW